MMEEMRYCRALHNVAAEINSSLDPTSVLQCVVEKTAQAMDVKACSMMMFDLATRELRHGVHHGLSDRYVGKGPLKVDSTLSEVLEGKVVAVRDSGTDSRIQYKAEAIEEGIATMLSVPIRLRGQVIGVMRVYTSDPREFSEEAVEFVEAVANLGAIALENAYRYTEARVDLESLRSYIYRYGGV